jgi:hypothetical protein
MLFGLNETETGTLVNAGVVAIVDVAAEPADPEVLTVVAKTNGELPIARSTAAEANRTEAKMGFMTAADSESVILAYR